MGDERAANEVGVRPIDSILSTTKWVVAALGAVATIVVAGLRIADLKDVHGTDRVLAVLGAGLAIFSVVYALIAAARVLTVHRFGIEELANAAMYVPPDRGPVRRRLRSIGEWLPLVPQRTPHLTHAARFIDRSPDLTMYSGTITDLTERRHRLVDLVRHLEPLVRAAQLRSTSAMVAKLKSRHDVEPTTALQSGDDSASPSPPDGRPSEDSAGESPARAEAGELLTDDQLSLLHLTAADLAGHAAATEADLLTFLGSEARDELVSVDRLCKTVIEIARYETTRRRFRDAMKALGLASIAWVVGLLVFATSMPSGEPTPKTPRHDRPHEFAHILPLPMPILVPYAPARDQCDQSDVDTLGALADRLGVGPLLDIARFAGVPVDDVDRALSILRAVRPDLIEAFEKQAGPIIDRWLPDWSDGNDPAGSEQCPGWSLILEAEIRLKLQGAGVPPDVAAQLAQLAVQAVETRIGVDLGGLTSFQGGTDIVIINSAQGGSVVIPDRTG